MAPESLPSPTPGSKPLPDVLVLAFVLGVGTLCSALAFVGLRQTEALRLQNIHTASARTVQDVLELDIHRTVEATHNISLVVESQPQVQRKQFDLLSRRVIADLHTLSAIRWLPAGGSEAAHEQQARVIGRPVASAVFPVVSPSHDGAGVPAIAITAPVYERDVTTDAIVRHRGFVESIVPLHALLRDAGNRANLVGMDLMVYDLEGAARAHTEAIYARLGTAAEDTPSEAHRAEKNHNDFVVALDVATRPWQVVLHPRPAFYADLTSSYAPYVLGAGLLLTGLITAAVWRAQRYRRSIEFARHRASRAREALALEQSRLQNIMEGTGVASWEFNYATRTLQVSERWGTMAGYTTAELGPNLYARWLELTHPDDLQRFFVALNEHFAGKTTHFDYEYRIRHQQGHWIWIGARARLLERDADGKPLVLGGTNLEITERKETEERIRQLNASLEQRMQEEVTRSEARATLGTLIASVSHEMGTPMGNSLMTASTLADQARHFQTLLDSGTLRRSALTEFITQVREGNALLMRNLERAVALLKNFRQVAADQASEQRRAFDLRKVLGEVLHTLAPSLKREAHAVTLEVPEGIAMDSYPGPLGQVVINLVNNAYLHAFEGMAQGTVQLRATATDSEVKLVCQDNGRGIAPETLEKMFMPFFSTRIGSGGTGLGMSIVDNLVKSTLGGSLHVDSVQGTGTTITITLPRVAPAPHSDAED
nr:ATP-binding protein [uncultured Rhodoferax sp.]